MKVGNPTDGGGSVLVRPARSEDIAGVSELHRGQFADHFLGKYPHEIVAAFYRSFGGDAVFLVAESEGKILGFVLGGDASYLQRCRETFVRRYWRRLFVATAARPGIWAAAIGRMRTIGRGDRHHAGFRSRAASRLLSIAVSDQAKGRGVAAALVAAFEEALGDAASYGLSVRDDNERALAFYRKIGFEVEAKHGGSTFFVRSLDD